MSGNLTKLEPTGELGPPMTTTPERLDIGSLLKYAVDKGVDAPTMERLMAIRRELNAEESKAAFDRAMAKFQAECPPVTKTIPVPTAAGKVAYSYAPMEIVVAVAQPHLKANGFSYKLDTDTESQAGWVIATCKVTHEAGHFDVSRIKLPLGTKTGIMSDTQVYAAALTFASRRVFCNAFGIVVASEDRDGSTGQKPKPPGPSSLHGEKAPTATDNENKKKLTDLTRSIHFAQGYNMNDDAKNKLTQWLIDEAFISDTQTVSDLSGAALAAVVAKVQAKLQPR